MASLCVPVYENPIVMYKIPENKNVCIYIGPTLLHTIFTHHFYTPLAIANSVKLQTINNTRLQAKITFLSLKITSRKAKQNEK